MNSFFNSEWASIFWDLTTRLVGKPIAIFVWWQLLTAPNVNEPIKDGKAVITGNYTPDEAKKISRWYKYLSYTCSYLLTSEKTIDAKLWLDSLHKLVIAWVIWFALIFVFLIYVYALSWALAWLALLIYTAILLVLIKLSGSVLTLTLELFLL